MRNLGSRLLVLALCLGLADAGARALTPDTRLIPMGDGIRLSTDIYLPEGKGLWPTVLVRTPYVNVKMSPLHFAVRWTQHGWAFIVQQTRGRGASEGKNLPFEGDGWADHRDGADATAWIAKQPWSDGRIATTGESALGIAELFLAGAGARPLNAQFIAIAEPSLYAGVYRQGVFRKALIEDWLRMYAHDADSLRLWRAHPAYDHFWEQRDATRKFGVIDAPAVHLGGWFDLFTQGTIDAVQEGYNEHGGDHTLADTSASSSGPGRTTWRATRRGTCYFPTGARSPPRRWTHSPGSISRSRETTMASARSHQSPTTSWGTRAIGARLETSGGRPTVGRAPTRLRPRFISTRIIRRAFLRRRQAKNRSDGPLIRPTRFLQPSAGPSCPARRSTRARWIKRQ